MLKMERLAKLDNKKQNTKNCYIISCSISYQHVILVWVGAGGGVGLGVGLGVGGGVGFTEEHTLFHAAKVLKGFPGPAEHMKLTILHPNI
jgi:hypothetical protein